MKRSLGMLVLLALLVPATAAAEAESGPIWHAPLALGPSDASSVSARAGLVVAGGRAHTKLDFRGIPEEVPSPRVAGIFSSTDDGRSWYLGRVTGSDEPVPGPPDVVAVGGATTDAFATFGTDVWRSRDDGVTWSQVGTLSGPATTLDVLHDGRLAAGLAGGGLRISADGGETWTQAGTGLPAYRVNEIVQMTETVLLAATEGGMYRSTDGGTTFTLSNPAGITAGTPVSAVAGIYKRGSLGAFLAVPASGFVGAHIYTSTNEGLSWLPRGPLVSAGFSPRVNTGALEFVVQSSTTTLFAGTPSGLHRADYPTGATNPWTKVEPEPGGRNVNDLASYDSDPSPNIQKDVLFATVQRASIFVSDTTGYRLAAPGWFDENEGGRICGGMVVHRSGDLIAACGRHVLRSSDGGASWQGAGKGLPTFGIVYGDLPYGPLEQGADGSLWTSGFYYGLYRSDAAVTNWSRVLYPGASVGVIAAHPTDPNGALAAGTATNGGETHVIWRTTDGGARWAAVYRTAARDYVYSIDHAEKVPDRVVAAISGSTGGVVYSHDGGATWQPSVGIPSGNSHSTSRAIFSPADADVAWAVVIHYLPGSNAEWLLYRSSDGGRTFTEAGTLPQLSAIWSDALEASPWDVDTLYLESVTQGVLVNRSGGATSGWSLMNQGLVGPYFDNLVFDPAIPGRLYATDGLLGAGADPPSQWVFRGRDPVAAGS